MSNKCTLCGMTADNPVHYVLGTPEPHPLATHWFVLVPKAIDQLTESQQRVMRVTRKRIGTFTISREDFYKAAREGRLRFEHEVLPMTKQRSIYLIGSLRNPRVPEVAKQLRDAGWDVFDDWYAAGPNADDCWRDYEKARGHDIVTALQGYAAQHVYRYDREHLERCTHAALLLPAGKSAHLELGIAIGQLKPGYIILDGDPDRYDAMYAYASNVFRTVEDFIEAMS